MIRSRRADVRRAKSWASWVAPEELPQSSRRSVSEELVHSRRSPEPSPLGRVPQLLESEAVGFPGSPRKVEFVVLRQPEAYACLHKKAAGVHPCKVPKENTHANFQEFATSGVWFQFHYRFTSGIQAHPDLFFTIPHRLPSDKVTPMLAQQTWQLMLFS